MSKFTTHIIKSRGSALIIALVFLLALTMIGTTAMQGTSQQESMAGNMRDRNLAFQAAEAGLRAAERWLQAQATAPNFTNGTGGTGYLSAQPDTFWITYNWNNQSLYSNNTTTPPTGALALTQLSRQPSYVIEDTTQDPSGAGNNDPNCASLAYRCYRITSRGVGGSPNAIVVLQATFYR